MQVAFTQDKSKLIRQMLSDLQNSVATGVLLVAVIILFALGFRASLFIGIAIPASFLAGVLGLQLAGLTDQHRRAVLADPRRRHAGRRRHHRLRIRRAAHGRGHGAEARPTALAAKRMAGPVIAATLTRVAAFSPLLFWPGVVGEFMKYMPITLIATLSASLAVALFFTPTLGALLGRAATVAARRARHARAASTCAPSRLALRHPGTTLGARACCCWSRCIGRLSASSATASSSSPRSSPTTARSSCTARGNLSLDEKDAALRQVEKTRAGDAGPEDRLHPRRRAAAGLERDHRGHDRRHPVRVRRLADAARRRT